MPKRSIEEYILEMERMRARATPPVIRTGQENPQIIKTGHEQPSVLRERQREIAQAAANNDISMAKPPSAERIEEIIDKTEEQTDDNGINDTEEAADDIEDIIEEKVEAAPGNKAAAGIGRLVVNVTSGAGLFPVESATVVVSDAASAGGSEIAAVKTDESGKTPVLYLPAPDKEMSQAPQSDKTPEQTRAQYTVTVSAPGYVTTVVEEISVFDDVTAIQKVDMLTVSAAGGNTAPRTINEKTIYRL